MYNSLVMKKLKEKLKKNFPLVREVKSTWMVKWGVGYKEKLDCYFIEECGTPNVFYLFEEELKIMENMVKEGNAAFVF